MSGVIDDMADAFLARTVTGGSDRRPLLQAIIRRAGEMLAESHGDDLVSATMAPLARKHAERASRTGVTFGKGRR